MLNRRKNLPLEENMQPDVYRKISKIAARIREEILPDLGAGDQIPSEQKISNLFGESYNRVHRALQMLIDEGLIFSSGGRKGMFYTPCYTKNQKRMKKKTVLKFATTANSYDPPNSILKRVFELFRMMEPFVEFEVVNGMITPDADICFSWPPLIDISVWKEIDLSRIHAVSEMIDGALAAGQQYGKQYAIPVLHSPASFWGHRNMLKRCGLKKEDFSSPEVFLEWGKKMEESGLCVAGYGFPGFTFHACQYGLEFRRIGNEFHLKEEDIRKCFRALENLEREKCTVSPCLNYDLFRRGQQGLYSGYLNSLPITEKRFELLGMPRINNGYVCQSMFIAGIGKHTKYEDLGYEFLNFLLSERVQKLFLTPRVNFSILDHVYRSQYSKLREETGVDIPPFDFRGVQMNVDPDLYSYIGNYIHLETILAFAGQKNVEQVIRNISRINIPERRRIWLHDAGEKQISHFEYFYNLLKKNPDFMMVSPESTTSTRKKR